MPTSCSLAAVTCTLTHTLLLLLTTTTILVQSYEIYDQLSDTIGQGEVRYYTLESNRPMVVVLISDEGDADMYASPTRHNSKPSSENHDYSSVSCGLDYLILLTSKEERKMSVGVHGHVRYEKSSFRLFVISPNDEDILKYQVWERDPLTHQNQLVIDADPLILANDPKLNELFENLRLGSSGENESTTKAFASKLVGWTGYALLKLLEVAIEVLAN